MSNPRISDSGLHERASEGLRHGFTLTELLAVIAVVAIVAALLLPVFARARKKSADIACLNNVRQMNLGLAQFVQEHREYPLDGSLTQGRFIWQRAVSAGLYGQANETMWTQSKGVWDCPAEKRPAYSRETGPYSDYGYNSYGCGNETNSFGLSGEKSKAFRPVLEDEIVQPSMMISLGDGFWGGPMGVGDGTPRLSRDARALPPEQEKSRAFRRHTGRANIGFVDGHVEPVKLSSLFSDDSDTALSQWNRDNKAHRAGR